MKADAVLIHGWDPNYYNAKVGENAPTEVAWSHRPELVRLLSERFEVSFYNLPGFAGTPEPQIASYDVENFAQEYAEWQKNSQVHAKLLIGYSFGGAVALAYKALTGDKIPTVLISPAIFRGSSTKSNIGHLAKSLVPEVWSEHFRSLYQTLTSRYYREGTPFLRNSYNRIVRRDLRQMLYKVDPGGLMLIYGSRDADTPWVLVKDDVDKLNLSHHVIAGGGHNIGQTNAGDIAQFITTFLETTQ